MSTRRIAQLSFDFDTNSNGKYNILLEKNNSGVKEAFGSRIFFYLWTAKEKEVRKHYTESVPTVVDLVFQSAIPLSGFKQRLSGR